MSGMARWQQGFPALVEQMKLKMRNRITSFCEGVFYHTVSGCLILPSPPSEKQVVSTCLSFILSSAERADGAPHKLTLSCAKNMLLIWHNAPSLFWWRSFAFQHNHISPVVNKEAMKVMQNSCLNVVGQQCQGTGSMAQVIPEVSAAELWSIWNPWGLLCRLNITLAVLQSSTAFALWSKTEWQGHCSGDPARCHRVLCPASRSVTNTGRNRRLWSDLIQTQAAQLQVTLPSARSELQYTGCCLCSSGNGL